MTDKTMELSERNRRMTEFFDRKAEGYDEVHLKMMGNKVVLTENLPENTARVLDLGIGTGLELVPMFARFPNLSVTGVDLSDKMLDELMKREFASHVTVLWGSFFEVNFGEHYDTVVSTSSLHHFDEENKLTLYQKIYASLRPGGVFLNSDKIVFTEEEQEANLQAYLTDPDRYAHMDTPLTPENEVKLLAAAGFRNITVSPAGDDNYRLFTAYR